MAVIDESKCTNCGICVEKCPTKVIQKMLPLSVQEKEETNFTSGEKSLNCQNCGLCP